ncbi:TIR domain-containing protein [Phocaeicola coprocola]|uniref:Thoeris protein ThsB TIR-like domain-containing protein n=1 Tax=Phocaeicola coprocola TaxID=310298 RepID=A0A412GR63_9BACT|nr:TIR domain-containing protein [Phocaeicola coprocola]RGR97297.1 hypothetical protein DWY20_07055 [Phocaeicola coprocola]
MAKKKVYVCFDYDRDKHYKYLMEAWNANPNFEFLFNDKSPREIQSYNISVIKSCLTKKIKEANYTVVLAGKDANKLHKDAEKIGYKNWQNFEVAQSVENGNKLIVVNLPDSTDAPDECYGHGAIWAGKYSQENIIKGLDEAAKK